MGCWGGAGGQEQGRHLPQPVRSAPRCRPGPTGRPTAWPCPIPSEGGGKCPSGAVWPRPRLAGQNEDTPGPPPRPPPAPRANFCDSLSPPGAALQRAPFPWDTPRGGKTAIAAPLFWKVCRARSGGQSPRLKSAALSR